MLKGFTASSLEVDDPTCLWGRRGTRHIRVPWLVESVSRVLQVGPTFVNCSYRIYTHISKNALPRSSTSDSIGPSLQLGWKQGWQSPVTLVDDLSLFEDVDNVWGST